MNTDYRDLSSKISSIVQDFREYCGDGLPGYIIDYLNEYNNILSRIDSMDRDERREFLDESVELLSSLSDAPPFRGGLAHKAINALVRAIRVADRQ